MPALLGDHMWQDGTGDFDQPGQVDGDLRPDIARRVEIFQPVQPPEAGVIEQDVDALVVLDHALDHVLNIRPVGHIYWRSHRLAAFSLDLCHQILKPVDPAGGQYYRWALARELAGSFLPQNAVGPRDPDDLLFSRHCPADSLLR